MHALLACDKPVVAAVTGAAVGIGTTMLLHCDLVYVADDARLAMPFVGLGLVPEFASSLLIPQLMGQRRAAEKLLLGDPFTAEQAVECGGRRRQARRLVARGVRRRGLSASVEAALRQRGLAAKRGHTAVAMCSAKACAQSR